MNTDVIFRVNGTDLSEFVTENDLRVKYTPVYDESSDFRAMDGNVKKTLLGFRADISASFRALPSEAASALSALTGTDKYNIDFAFPDLRSARFETLSLTMEPERMAGSETYWSAFLAARSDVIPQDGL